MTTTAYPATEPPPLPTVAPTSASAAHVAAARAAASEAILTTGTTATFGLAARIVRAAPLAEAPRRGDRVLPGRADTSVAAAYMLGATPDPSLQALLAQWDVGAPRATRVKAAEAVYKERVKTLIAGLNERGGRESRAENLAALRVCEVIADVLDGHVVREMADAVAVRDKMIESLQQQVASLQRQMLADGGGGGGTGSGYGYRAGSEMSICQ